MGIETELKFWINCDPPRSTHQSALRIHKQKNGKLFVGRSNKGIKIDKELQILLLPHRPRVPIEDPIELEILWVFPYRKSEPKKNRGGLIPCQTRPDADNLIKGLLDAMTKISMWKDDGLIYSIKFEKYFGANSGIGVKIRSKP